MRRAFRNKAKILIMDDSQIATWEFDALLQERGYEVTTALSGKEALAKAARFAPDLLVSKVGQDNPRGIKAAVQIREMLPGCKVLFLSAHASMADVSQAVPKNFVYSFASSLHRSLDLLNAIGYMVPPANIST